MTDAETPQTDATENGEQTLGRLAAAKESAMDASERHVALAVPLRAVERNKRVAASVLAGGFAYRIFLWLLPFGLVVGGALGFLNANDTEDAVERGGLPGAITNTIGDAARDANSDRWWLLVVGLPLLVWAGYGGAKAVQLIHALVWDEPPPKTKLIQGSLAFTGTLVAFFLAVGVTWWFRDATTIYGFIPAALTVAPLAALWLWVSLNLPHRDASWRDLLPGALLVAVGFQVLHEAVGHLLVPKIEKSTSIYGDLGAVTTLLFFMYMLAILVVSAPVLNSSLYDELNRGATRSPGRRDGLNAPGGVYHRALAVTTPRSSTM